MKTTTLQSYGGLTYITLFDVPVKETRFGDAIDLPPRELDKIVSTHLILEKVPIRGIEFRILKSALDLSNEAIASKIGVSRNTVLKWGKEIEKRIPYSYEMLLRLLVAEHLQVSIGATLDDLRASDEAREISIKAA